MKVTYTFNNPADVEDAIQELQRFAYFMRLQMWQCDICDKWIKYEINDEDLPNINTGTCKECQSKNENHL